MLCARDKILQDYAIGTTNRSSIFIDEVYNPPSHPPTTPHYTHARTHARTHAHSQGRVSSDILDVYTAQ
jgi:hypothetical protein